MLSKHQAFLNSDYILLIVWVSISEGFEDACFNKALLVQSFLVAEDLEGGEFLPLVVPSFENLSKRPLADPLVDLEAIGDVVMDVTDVLTLVVVKTTVFRSIRRG